jgi:single-strand DNA-binding protein
MSLNYNRVTVAGNLTRDPEVKFLPGDKAVANFSIAINRKYKDGNGAAREDVLYLDIEAWGRTAELAGQYLTKGSNCFVEGRLKLDSWEDAKTKEKRTKIRVVADSVQFIGIKGGAAAPAEGETSAAEGGAPAAQPQASADRPARTTRPATREAAVQAGTDDEPPF